MNRVRKFKAYDKHTKKRVTDPMSFYMSMDDDGTLNVMHNIIVCDFTGFKHKNGTEIFEGDILKSWYSRDMSGTDIITTINEVEYDIKKESSGFEIVFLENSEIIGNVIENPELLGTS